MNDIIMGGTWNILGKEYNGDLIINEKEQRLGLIIYSNFDMDLISNNSKLIPRNIGIISGVVNRGIKYTLFGNLVVKRHGEGFSRCIIYIASNYCVTGIDIVNNRAEFNKIKFKLSDTLYWTGLWGNESLRFNDKYNLEDYVEVIGYKFKKDFFIKLNDVSIRFNPIAGGYKSNWYSKEYVMRQDVAIEIEKNKLTDFNKFIESLDILKEFIIFTLRIPIYITDIKGNNENYMREISGKKYYEDIKIYHREVKNIEDSIESIIDLDNEIITFGKIKNKSTVLKSWFKKYKKLKEIINFNNNNIEYKNSPSYIRFINISQALELFHYNFICKNLSELNKRINNFNNCSNKIKLSNKVKTIQNGEKRYILFENRILDLLLVEYDFVFYDNFGSLDVFKFANKVANTRHYFVHRNKNKEKYIFEEKEIETAIYILEMLLAYYILKEIGVNKEIVKKIIIEKLDYLKHRKTLN